MPTFTLPESFDHAQLERECRDLWDRARIYAWDPDGDAPAFSVDTPPPYVSAAHLHVGHAMSYSQAEFVVRYRRMRGDRVFYPMGFDDNGLPTERYVETRHAIDKRRTTRSAFRALCLEETRAGAATYQELWRALGLSVDWSLSYSTIDDHCRATAQRSFLDLFAKGRLYRSDQPVTWDPQLETALAQADLETLSRRAQLHELAFAGPDGELLIATTRPELLGGCVALYRNPEDPRWAHLAGRTARVPLFGWEVPILADPDVRQDFGTGLMMVCTFGDADDVRRWRRDGLATRPAVGRDGRMTAGCGPFAGMTTTAARAATIKALEEAGLHRGQRTVEQQVPVAERSGAPVELVMAPQWFVRVLDLKDDLLARSAQLQWNPPHMKTRLDDWIRGLQWDWNISRQRFYGVPFPVWLCESCGEAVLARAEDLPVDPLEDAPPCSACPRCGGALRGDPDVMDTWMTSSLTPAINANTAGTPGRTAGPLPMTTRVQAFEIIRSWLFYTLCKSHLHDDALPWSQVMISGWGLNEQGKKISKRDLESHTDADGFNRYEPHGVIAKYGADALRWWAASAHLGHDLRYHEKHVRAGRKLVVKLWNVARFASLHLGDYDPTDAPPLADRPPEDRWVLGALDATVPIARRGFDACDYGIGRDAIDRTFFASFCDDWLEIAKDRLMFPERYGAASRRAAQATLWEGLRTLLGLLAPYVPFVTESLWQRIYAPFEDAPSLHVTAYPEARGLPEVPELDDVRAVLEAVRALRTERRMTQSLGLAALVVEGDVPDGLRPTLLAAARALELRSGPATRPAGRWRIEIEP